jgi:hypothetical protein
MTGLTTFLAPNDTAMALAEAQYPYLALDA